jgi:hypothetical protein
MKNKKVLKIIILIIGIVAVYFIDLHDRLDDSGSEFSSMSFVDNEYRLGDENKDSDYPKELYKRNFKNEKYKFPRTEVSKIRVYRNIPIISRLTGKTVSEQTKTELEVFFNSPENFTWGETTWTLSESDFILRYYDSNDMEIGKVWFCLDDCIMTFSIPFSPNMKFGSLSKVGFKKLETLVK